MKKIKLAFKYHWSGISLERAIYIRYLQKQFQTSY